MTTTDFDILREESVPSIQGTATLLRHRGTGGEVLSISNGDENKCFGISFRTPPEDSTGVAHILEHCVLAGSRKFPLKDPFAELLKGSLQTFLNAFTFPDKTCYPVASQNEKDFYNLVDVYLDTVFYPLLRRETFEQQGWHLELEDREAPLIYKGVVYNEMKGVYSSSDALLGRYSQRSLFPETTYGLDSGGDPQAIVDLTYEQFRAFHKQYYHPSNSLTFFYGNDDPARRLSLLAEYFNAFDALPSTVQIPLHSSFSEPRSRTERYPIGPSAHKKEILTVNWKLGEKRDPILTLSLTVLNHILVGTPASPLRKALISSGLGENLAGGGLSTDLREATFSTGLKGIAPGRASEVEQLVLRTLTDLTRQGIDPDTVAASLNTVEFHLRENNTGGFPRGLVAMLRSLSVWLYGGDPFAPLHFEAALEELRRRVAPGYFETLIHELFVENTHRTTVHLLPDPELAERLEQEERARLSAVRAGFDEQQLDLCIKATQELRKFEETPDSPEVLHSIPSLALEDLERTNREIPFASSQLEGMEVITHDLFTNHIVYLDLAMNMLAVPPPLVHLMSVAGRCMVELGTERDDYVRLLQRIGRSTGGFTSSSLSTVVRDTRNLTAWLILRGKATLANVGELCAIASDLLLLTKWDDRERVREIVRQEKGAAEARLVPQGHGVANTRLRAHYSPGDWIAEQIGGTEYLFALRRLLDRIETDWHSVQQELRTVAASLVNRHTTIANVTCGADDLHAVRPHLESFARSLPERAEFRHEWKIEPLPAKEALVVPSQVNFVAKGGPLYASGYALHGSALVVTRFLRSTWLWERVRVQGGAYGGFASFDHRSGIFSYLSYRDPNLTRTLEVYDRTVEFLATASLTDQEITRAIIGTISDFDAYQLPDAKGFTSLVRWLAHDTLHFRQTLREEVLGTTIADFRRFGEALAYVRDHGDVVVLGGGDMMERESSALGLQLTRVI